MWNAGRTTSPLCLPLNMPMLSSLCQQWANVTYLNWAAKWKMHCWLIKDTKGLGKKAMFGITGWWLGFLIQLLPVKEVKHTFPASCSAHPHLPLNELTPPKWPLMPPFLTRQPQATPQPCPSPPTGFYFRTRTFQDVNQTHTMQDTYGESEQLSGDTGPCLSICRSQGGEGRIPGQVQLEDSKSLRGEDTVWFSLNLIIKITWKEIWYNRENCPCILKQLSSVLQVFWGHSPWARPMC